MWWFISICFAVMFYAYWVGNLPSGKPTECPPGYSYINLWNHGPECIATTAPVRP